MIELTNLQPTATKNDIINLCKVATEKNYHAVCVNPCYVKLAKQYFHNVVTVIGFPLGATTHKYISIEHYHLADELDVVMNIGLFKSGDYDDVKNELDTFVKICKRFNKICKIIIETNLLTKEEIIIATKIVKSIDADYIKTCTGFFGPMKINDVKLIHETCPKLFIKASGGIKNINQINELKIFNVKRIGTSTIL